MAGFESAASFAELLTVNEHTYRRWERGEMQPPLDVLVEIARASGQSIDFLLTGKKTGDNPGE